MLRPAHHTRLSTPNLAVAAGEGASTQARQAALVGASMAYLLGEYAGRVAGTSWFATRDINMNQGRQEYKAGYVLEYSYCVVD